MRAALILLVALTVTACDSVGLDTAITRYSGPEITEASATVPNPPLDPVGWTGSKFVGFRSTEVTLAQRTLCGDECSRTVRFTFTSDAPREADALPESVRGVVEIMQGNPDGAERTELTIGQVEIQDWGPRIYSGVVVPGGEYPPNVDPPPPTVFWAEITEIAVE